MAIEHENDSDDRPAKSRWLAPGVLDRALELTEGIRTSVDAPPPPSSPPPPKVENEWVPDPEPAGAPESRRPQPSATPSPQPAADRTNSGRHVNTGDQVWREPRITTGRPAPPPEVPLSRRLRNLTLRSQATTPLTRGWIAAGIVVAILAGIAGLIVGKAGGAEEPEHVSKPGFSITLPGDWKRRPATAATGELALSDAVIAGPADQQDAVLSAGALASGAAPGSRSLARSLDPSPGRAELVRLGRVPAYRYENLQRPGSETATTLYVVPQRSSSLAIVCSAPRGADSFLEDCAEAATTISPTGAAGATRVALERYLNRVGATVRRLGDARRRGRFALARGETPKGQALAAKTLDRLFRRTAARVGRIRGGGSASASVRPLVRDLRATARAYRRLALAAAKGSPGAFRSARSAVGRAEAAVNRRLAAL